MNEDVTEIVERLKKEICVPENADFVKAFLGALHQKEVNYPKREWEYARPSLHSTDQEIRSLTAVASHKSSDYYQRQRALFSVIVEAVKALSLLTP